MLPIVNSPWFLPGTVEIERIHHRELPGGLFDVEIHFVVSGPDFPSLRERIDNGDCEE